jgi:UDP-N-acetylmuramoyl-L-alanyl-D-glutamate--2,6-diaminopimelate ligase
MLLLQDIHQLLPGAVVQGDPRMEVLHLAYHTGKVQLGGAFFAIRGNTVDGHRYIDAAIEAGAALIVAEEAPEREDIAWVHVKNARVALACVAVGFYKEAHKKLKLLAVTGTNGKTTTTYLIHYLLNATLNRCGLLGTIEYDVGLDQKVVASHTTPESLEMHELFAQMRDNGCRACAMEVSSHALDQGRVDGLNFYAGVFTNLTQDHLDYHGSMEAYFEAKMKLFDSIAKQPKGNLIINGDDLYGRKLIEKYKSTGRVISFGFGSSCDLRASLPRYQMNGTQFELEYRKKNFLVRMPLVGDFNIYNVMGALLAAKTAGMNLSEGIRLLANAPQVPGRLQRVTDEKSVFSVYVDYAHTPDGLVQALKSLRALQPERLVTIFGCGGDRDKGKRPLMAKAAEEGSDHCVVSSDNPRSEEPLTIIQDAIKGFSKVVSYEVVEDRREAIEQTIRGMQARQILLIAGKGHEKYQEIQGIRHDFDDVVEARRVMRDINAVAARERRMELDEERERRAPPGYPENDRGFDRREFDGGGKREFRRERNESRDSSPIIVEEPFNDEAILNSDVEINNQE